MAEFVLEFEVFCDYIRNFLVRVINHVGVAEDATEFGVATHVALHDALRLLPLVLVHLDHVLLLVQLLPQLTQRFLECQRIFLVFPLLFAKHLLED